MSGPHSHLCPGVPLALGQEVLFEASAPLAKLLIGSVDPWLLAGLLSLGAGVGLAFVHRGRAALGLRVSRLPCVGRRRLGLRPGSCSAGSSGLPRMYASDLEQLEAGMSFYDAFYRWPCDATDEIHTWPNPRGGAAQ